MSSTYITQCDFIIPEMCDSIHYQFIRYLETTRVNQRVTVNKQVLHDAGIVIKKPHYQENRQQENLGFINVIMELTDGVPVITSDPNSEWYYQNALYGQNPNNQMNLMNNEISNVFQQNVPFQFTNQVNSQPNQNAVIQNVMKQGLMSQNQTIQNPTYEKQRGNEWNTFCDDSAIITTAMMENNVNDGVMMRNVNQRMNQQIAMEMSYDESEDPGYYCVSKNECVNFGKGEERRIRYDWFGSIESFIRKIGNQESRYVWTQDIMWKEVEHEKGIKMMMVYNEHYIDTRIVGEIERNGINAMTSSKKTLVTMYGKTVPQQYVEIGGVVHCTFSVLESLGILEMIFGKHNVILGYHCERDDTTLTVIVRLHISDIKMYSSYCTYQVTGKHDFRMFRPFKENEKMMYFSLIEKTILGCLIEWFPFLETRC